MNEPWLLWVLLALFVIGSGLFSGAETGFYVLDRFRLAILSARGRRRARSLSRLVADTDGLLITCLIGTNLCNQLATESCIAMLRDVVDPTRQELLVALVLTPVLFFFGEVLPKDLFRARAESLIYATWRLVWLSRILFLPAIALLRAVGWGLDRLLGGGEPGGRRYRGRKGVEQLLDEGAATGVLTAHEIAFARNVLRLEGRSVKDVMIPRSGVVFVEAAGTVEDLLRVARRHPHGRFPLREGRGLRSYVAVEDALRAEPSRPLLEIARPTLRLPAALPVAEALEAFRDGQRALATVVGEQSQALGILTAKDLVEEIVGEFPDL